MDSVFPCLMIGLCMCVKKVERIFKDLNLRSLGSVLPPMISSQSQITFNVIFNFFGLFVTMNLFNISLQGQ